VDATSLTGARFNDRRRCGTLEVRPVLYTMWRHRQLRHAQRLGVSIDQIVGPPPAWARD
jgi:exonuclease III